jgi:predicted Zn-dependent protease
MKRLTTVMMSVAVACSGCVAMVPIVTNTVSQMNANDVQNLVGKVQSAVQAQRDLTDAEEVALGGGIAANMLGAAPPYADKKVQQYVNNVGNWLAAQTERADLTWHFVVLDDTEFNAFAAPGGYIFITRGLLQGLHNEAELAGVLAHEIAHVLRKHHLQALKSGANKALWADIGSTVMAKNSQLTQNGQLTPALSKLAAVGTEMYTRGLDKDDEFEADRMGVVIAARAGYDPYGLPAVLQSLQTVSPNSAGLALMFKTHPSFTSRLDKLALVMNEKFDAFENQPNLAPRFTAQLAAKKAPVKK